MLKKLTLEIHRWWQRWLAVSLHYCSLTLWSTAKLGVNLPALPQTCGWEDWRHRKTRPVPSAWRGHLLRRERQKALLPRKRPSQNAQPCPTFRCWDRSRCFVCLQSYECSQLTGTQKVSVSNLSKVVLSSL